MYLNPFDFKEKKKFKNKQEEYRHGDWRRMPSVYVTLETPIPELPAKEIATPDEAAFHKKQIELENKIKDHYKNADDLKEKFTELVDQKKAQREGKKTYEPKETRDKRQRFNHVNNEKKRIREAIDEIEKNRGELIRKREQLIKFIHPKWNTPDLVPKGLKELKKQMETSSGGRKEEEKYIKEVKKLNDSVKYIEEKEQIDAQLNDIFKKKKTVSAPLSKLIEESKELWNQLNQEQKEKEEKVENLENLDKQIDRVSEKRKKEYDEIDKLKA